MSKLVCPCGNVISDSHYPSSTEGLILRQQDQEPFQNALAKDVAAFMQADQEGRRAEWIQHNMTPPVSTDASDEEIVDEIYFKLHAETGLSVCECSECGRLHVQRKTFENVYLAYAPDQRGYHAVLTTDQNEAL